MAYRALQSSQQKFSEADKFFENFEQEMQFNTEESQGKKVEQYISSKQICKSLERMFQQCTNSTLKKNPVQINQDSTKTQGLVRDQNGSQKYIEANRNHSFNQLKCIFQQKCKLDLKKVTQNCRLESHRVSLNTQSSANISINGLTQVPGSSKQSGNGAPLGSRSKNKENVNPNKYVNSPKRFEQKIGQKSYLDNFIQKQLQKQSQEYLAFKQSFNKQSSDFSSFHANPDNPISSNSQQRKESLHSRSRNQSQHGQVINQNNNAYSLSLVQFLKPRYKMNQREQNSGSVSNNTTMLGLNQTSSQATPNPPLFVSKQLVRQVSMMNSSKRNISPSPSSTLVTTRVPKQYINLDVNKSIERSVNASTLSQYFHQDQQKQKRTASRNKFNSIVSNQTITERSSFNQPVYINFADFKKAVEKQKS